MYAHPESRKTKTYDLPTVLDLCTGLQYNMLTAY